MRAVVVEQPGGLENLNITQVPEPVPGPGAIQIRIAFAGCNWSDIQKRQGVYPDPVDYPVILGAEVSGIVSAAGRGVDLVIDSLGADVLPRSFDAVRTYGRVINIGEAAGYPNFDIRGKLYERSTSLAGFELHHAEPGSARWRKGVRHVLDGLARGWLEVPIQGVHNLDDIRIAQQRLEGRGVAGKLLIAVAGE